MQIIKDFISDVVKYAFADEVFEEFFLGITASVDFGERAEFGVGTEDEMKTSCYEYVEQLVDDIGYKGFNESFAMDYIDEEAVLSEAEEIFDQDVRDNPESYISEDNRMISDDQEEKIKIFLYLVYENRIFFYFFHFLF